MDPSSSRVRTSLLYFAATVLTLVGAFFVFYTVRLLYVTHWLTETRTGGQGAYVGAIVFPLLGILLGWGAWRCVRTAQRK
jgi:hypothetical protein